MRSQPTSAPLVFALSLTAGCSSPSGVTDDLDADTQTGQAPQSDTHACHAQASTPTAELSGTGIVNGETAYDFELADQNGDLVSLYDFHGCVVVLDLITQWCIPCQDAAPEFEAISQDMAPDVAVLAVMLQTTDGGPPDVEHVQWWADSFDLTYPVLADPYASQYNYTNGSFPTVVVIDRDMTIVDQDWDHEELEFLDTLL